MLKAPNGTFYPMPYHCYRGFSATVIGKALVEPLNKDYVQGVHYREVFCREVQVA